MDKNTNNNLLTPIYKKEIFDVVSLDKFNVIENEHGKYIIWEYTKNGEKNDGVMPVGNLIDAIEFYCKNNSVVYNHQKL